MNSNKALKQQVEKQNAQIEELQQKLKDQTKANSSPIKQAAIESEVSPSKRKKQFKDHDQSFFGTQEDLEAPKA